MRIRLAITGLALAFIVCGWTVNVMADTVYLKNGRTIRSSSVRVEGDRIYVRLFQGEVAFPLDQVERIVENEAVERATVLPSPQEPAPVEDAASEPTPTEDAESSSADEQSEAGEPPVEEPEEEPETPPEETREYWQDRLRPLRDQLTRMDRELRSLRLRNGADVEAQIARLETRRAGVQEQVDAIVREGRRMGVPSGWLR